MKNIFGKIIETMEKDLYLIENLNTEGLVFLSEINLLRKYIILHEALGGVDIRRFERSRVAIKLSGEEFGTYFGEHKGYCLIQLSYNIRDQIAEDMELHIKETKSMKNLVEYNEKMIVKNKEREKEKEKEKIESKSKLMGNVRKSIDEAAERIKNI